MAATASPSTSANSPSRRSPTRATAAVIAVFLVAFGLTIAFRPVIGRTIFVFMYGAVAAAALYAGVVAGMLAAVASVVLVNEFVLSDGSGFSFATPQDFASVAAFLSVSLIIALIARSMREERIRAERAAAQLREQAVEMAAHQAEAESLAEELEQSTAELEMAMEDANEQRNAAVASEERLRLLDEVARVLSSSLDYETTIAAVARLAVPKFADWAAVDLLLDGEIKQLAVAHVDPEKAAWAREINAKYPVDPRAPGGVPAVIRSGRPELIRNVTDEMLVAAAVSEEHLRLLREVGLYSAVIVPMIARDQILGAITLVSSNPSHHFDEADVSLMMHLARRSAMAIDNARLYRSALVANEAKANFLATMSHELRTPLTAIIGYEELLAEGISGPVNDAQRLQLQRVKISATHLLTLIDEILLYARAEAGRETINLSSVAARAVVDEAVSIVSPAAAQQALTITSEGIDPALTLRTDAGKLRQMLVNLLVNAVKFTPAGKISIQAFARDADVIFEVRDTGIGIARENLESIFDPFWQVDQAATRRAGGSGLGLSVTKRLASLLGGTVGVESEPGAGSTFRITLPREPTAEVERIAAGN